MALLQPVGQLKAIILDLVKALCVLSGSMARTKRGSPNRKRMPATACQIGPQGVVGVDSGVSRDNRDGGTGLQLLSRGSRRRCRGRDCRECQRAWGLPAVRCSLGFRKKQMLTRSLPYNILLILQIPPSRTPPSGKHATLLDRFTPAARTLKGKGLTQSGGVPGLLLRRAAQGLPAEVRRHLSRPEDLTLAEVRRPTVARCPC